MYTDASHYPNSDPRNRGSSSSTMDPRDPSYPHMSVHSSNSLNLSLDPYEQSYPTSQHPHPQQSEWYPVQQQSASMMPVYADFGSHNCVDCGPPTTSTHHHRHGTDQYSYVQTNRMQSYPMAAPVYPQEMPSNQVGYMYGHPQQEGVVQRSYPTMMPPNPTGPTSYGYQQQQSYSPPRRRHTGEKEVAVGRWNAEEHQWFLKGLEMFQGPAWGEIARLIGTRTSTQVRTHAQKYFAKLARSNQSLPYFEAQIDKERSRLVAQGAVDPRPSVTPTAATSYHFNFNTLSPRKNTSADPATSVSPRQPSATMKCARDADHTGLYQNYGYSQGNVTSSTIPSTQQQTDYSSSRWDGTQEYYPTTSQPLQYVQADYYDPTRLATSLDKALGTDSLGSRNTQNENVSTENLDTSSAKQESKDWTEWSNDNQTASGLMALAETTNNTTVDVDPESLPSMNKMLYRSSTVL